MASFTNSFREYNSKLHLSKEKEKKVITLKKRVYKTSSNSNYSIFTHEHNWENKCPGGKDCKNYNVIIQLQYQIKRLTQTIEQLNKINDYFSFNMVQKEFMYKEMLKENTKIQNSLCSKYISNSFRGEKQRNDYDNRNYNQKNQYKIFSINDINDEIFTSDYYSETEYDEEEEKKRKEEEKELIKSKLEKKPIRSFKRMKTVNIEHHPNNGFDIDNTNKCEGIKNFQPISNGGRKILRNKTKRVQIQLDCNSKLKKIFSSLNDDKEKKEEERRKKEEEEKRKKEEEERKKKEEEERRKKEEEENNKKKKNLLKIHIMK